MRRDWTGPSPGPSYVYWGRRARALNPAQSASNRPPEKTRDQRISINLPPCPGPTMALI